MSMDPELVLANLAAIPWMYGDRDPVAHQQLHDRIACSGRLGETITYTDLVRGIAFIIPGVRDGNLFFIEADEDGWLDLDRRIIGDFLAYLSFLSFRSFGFFASALVVRRGADRMPSYRFFFDFAERVGAIPDIQPETCLEFWTQQVADAIAHYQDHP